MRNRVWKIVPPSPSRVCVNMKTFIVSVSTFARLLLLKHPSSNVLTLSERRHTNATHRGFTLRGSGRLLTRQLFGSYSSIADFSSVNPSSERLTRFVLCRNLRHMERKSVSVLFRYRGIRALRITLTWKNNASLSLKGGLPWSIQISQWRDPWTSIDFVRRTFL